MNFTDTIVALATPAGVGAIGVIRLSGDRAIEIVNAVFKPKDLSTQPTHTIHYGRIESNGRVYDEVVASLYIAPRSYTKENVVEISCHGSPFIQESILQLFVEQGARFARPGEFTQRAFLNGAFDLAQAEAVADVIAADSAAAQNAALHQLRGGFSKELAALREELIHFASLIELELDFGEEDVEFADRKDLEALVNQLLKNIRPLVSSFRAGNAVKNGVATVIVGKPNAGKSTLLNALLNEDRAIVSDIAGTTRDSLEDEWTLGGIKFRLVDTAGLRETSDVIEALGVERTQAWVKKAQVVIYMADATSETPDGIAAGVEALGALEIPVIKLLNKVDQIAYLSAFQSAIPDLIPISAKNRDGLNDLETALLNVVGLDQVSTNGTLVTNLRHYQQLLQTQETLEGVLIALKTGLTGDLIAQDLRYALHHLGEITGQISNDDLLKNIFGKFCIGK
ncbi:tRNA uridine-5-carboxymethylaminomethyl(34) synthesis GTPase MnmE [Aquirufa antheringensis]|uniref:tRNA uridine-5-carboxymethylaminomethyl(34) synthesis GTPase MnmE n=1 Tax=Aquirufa antheringensis TaxID=2516559 RepID=UPI0022A8266F|nr:tRNA uridine-5-carboxymethylaminomethyl(34) synthesis GTPase MnmE [Aquirufa antheringensis]MCZ2483970.1 tRNA uridine-5-carboxymethylaminomethyl(34) synthesis GTPase MnmE [Aquirufa antheringensis]MCZ2488160.1 tRNA uridine-5-carboxymethylaminomethyl(34) synthesis GTPase MnmE [Aquirufa antheringensis]MCZ2489095.1 tRNA uridine-5-carboxymethylaminomethyl(34) synthesis GTPase MnmE [Aquirufa antheringensis]